MLGTTAMRRYMAAMTARGIPAEIVLADSGVEVAQLAETGHLLTPSQYRFIVNRLIQLNGDAGLGFTVSAFKDLSDLGIVGHASGTSRSVRDTHRLWTRFGPPLVGMMGKLRILEEDAGSVTMGFSSPDPSDPLFRFSVEELLTMVRMLGRSPHPDRPPSVQALSLSYRAPRHADHYEELLGCRLRFGAPQTTIRLSREWFDDRSQAHDEEFDAICRQHCESVLHRVERRQPMSGELRKLFAVDAAPPPRLETAAARLHMTPRTLRRRLHDEGTSYRAQVDAYRAERAKQYLAYGTLDPKEVAFLLGFKEQSAFRHAFKSWTGMTIREFRRQATAESAAGPH